MSFSKYALRKRRRSNAVELGLAVLLEGFANHLGRQASLHVPEALDRVIAILDLRLVLVLERLLGELLLKLRSLEAALQFVALLLDRTDCLGDRELLRNLDASSGLQPGSPRPCAAFCSSFEPRLG